MRGKLRYAVLRSPKTTSRGLGLVLLVLLTTCSNPFYPVGPGGGSGSGSSWPQSAGLYIKNADRWQLVTDASLNPVGEYGYLSRVADYMSAGGREGDYLMMVGNSFPEDSVVFQGNTIPAWKRTLMIQGLNGMKTIWLGTGATNSLLTILSNNTITLSENITLQGNIGLFPLVRINTSPGFPGILIMEGNAVITEHNNGGGDGGGVYVGGGTFTMNGGTIEDNAAINGGGVYVDGGTFTMNGGTIENNETYTSGGGVGMGMMGGNFIMNAGSTIKNNTADADGGGVEVLSGTFTMNGGIIEGNEAADRSGYGGGVRVAGSSSIFYMPGGTIIGNTADVLGNSLCVQAGAIAKYGAPPAVGSDIITDPLSAGIDDPLTGHY